MRKFMVIMCFFALLACDEKAEVEQPVVNHEGPTFADELDVTTNRRVELLPEARAQVIEWLAYVTAQDEMESLRNKTGAEIVGTSNSLMQIMENLQQTLPDTLQTPAIQSRTNVLVTKSKVLNQLSSKKDKDPKEIFHVANDLIIEFDNFKLQVNELFLKSPGDFEIELDREFEESRSRDELAERE